MKYILWLGSMALMLSGCSLFPGSNSDPAKKYVLPILSPSYAEPNAAVPYQLIVDLPTLYPPIDTTRIALKPQEQLVDYYADVEWANRLSVLIQESLIYSFQNRGAFRGVSRATEGIQGDYALKIEVRKFYIDQPGNPALRTAQVDYMAHLVKLPGRHIVASKSFSFIHSIPENTMDDIVNSLAKAHLQASEALIPWIGRNLPWSPKGR